MTRKPKLGRYFSLASDNSLYICRENAMVMYRIIRGKATRILLKGAANIKGGEDLGMEVELLDEAELWPYKLWVGSFYG